MLWTSKPRDFPLCLLLNTPVMVLFFIRYSEVKYPPVQWPIQFQGKLLFLAYPSSHSHYYPGIRLQEVVCNILFSPFKVQFKFNRGIMWFPWHMSSQYLPTFPPLVQLGGTCISENIMFDLYLWISSLIHLEYIVTFVLCYNSYFGPLSPLLCPYLHCPFVFWKDCDELLFGVPKRSTSLCPLGRAIQSLLFRLCTIDCVLTSDHFCVFLLDPLHQVHMSLVYWGLQRWMQYSR